MLYHTHICVLSHSCVCILYVIHISVSVYLSWETHISVTDTYTHISVCISNVIHISVSVYIFWETWETLMLRDSHGSQIYWETHRSQICWEICESLKSLKICESLILRDSHISQHICDRWDTHRSQIYVSLSYWETHIYILRDSHILRDLRDSHIERLTSVTDMLRDSHIERLTSRETHISVTDTYTHISVCIGLETHILRDSHRSQICWETHIYILRDSHILRDLRDSHIERLTYQCLYTYLKRLERLTYGETHMLRDSHIERLTYLERLERLTYRETHILICVLSHSCVSLLYVIHILRDSHTLRDSHICDRYIPVSICLIPHTCLCSIHTCVCISYLTHISVSVSVHLERFKYLSDAHIRVWYNPVSIYLISHTYLCSIHSCVWISKHPDLAQRIFL